MAGMLPYPGPSLSVLCIHYVLGSKPQVLLRVNDHVGEVSKLHSVEKKNSEKKGVMN